MKLAILTRHGQSLLNVERVVNGDPARDRGLSGLGVEQGEQLGRQLAGIAIDRCVCSEFPRARQTARLALGGRNLPELIDPDLNDIRIGAYEGKTIDEYEAWKHTHPRDDAIPGGESLNDAARRYADAFERVLELPDDTILVACHEIPVRYAANAAAGSAELDGPVHAVPNATPFLFDAESLGRAIARMRELATAPR